MQIKVRLRREQYANSQQREEFPLTFISTVMVEREERIQDKNMYIGYGYRKVLLRRKLIRFSRHSSNLFVANFFHAARSISKLIELCESIYIYR